MLYQAEILTIESIWKLEFNRDNISQFCWLHQKLNSNLQNSYWLCDQADDATNCYYLSRNIVGASFNSTPRRMVYMDLIRLMEAKLEKKLFMQDNVVLAHYMTVIKDLINPLIAISLTMLNRFFCWTDGSVTKNTLVIVG